LTAVTFLSRLTLFTGVKRIGGMQTSILGLAQLLVAVTLAVLWLKESLSLLQWIGAAVLVLALVMVGKEGPDHPTPHGRGWLYWLRPPVTEVMSSVNGASPAKSLTAKPEEGFEHTPRSR